MFAITTTPTTPHPLVRGRQGNGCEGVVNADGTVDVQFVIDPTDLAGLAELERQAVVDEFVRMVHGDKAL